MTTLPAYLNNAHLPIKEGMLLDDVIGLVVMVYGYQLIKTNYKDTQAYVGTDGFVSYDLITVDSELLTTFVNRASNAVKHTDTPILSVITLNKYTWLAKQIALPDAVLLNPFAVLSNGYVYDGMSSLGDWAFKLATLLNDYSSLGDWKMSSFAPYSTSKFKIVYQGVAKSAPSDLRMPKSDAQCMIIDIQAGNNQGLICFLVTQ